MHSLGTKVRDGYRPSDSIWTFFLRVEKDDINRIWSETSPFSAKCFSYIPPIWFTAVLPLSAVLFHLRGNWSVTKKTQSDRGRNIFL